MNRRSLMVFPDPRAGLLVLAIAFLIVGSGCTKSGSSSQSNASSSTAPTAAGAATAATTVAIMAKLPVYPGATLAASSTAPPGQQPASSEVYTTRDSFDKVYSWYQNALPAHSETSHEKAQMQESAVFTLGSGAKTQTVSILMTSGVEVINITLTTTGQ